MSGTTAIVTMESLFLSYGLSPESYLLFIWSFIFSLCISHFVFHGLKFPFQTRPKVFEGLIVWGELFMQPNHCANKATLNRGSNWLMGLAMEFLEDWGGLLERTGREKRGFPELAVQEKPRREDLCCRLFAVFGCMRPLSQFLPPEFLLHQNNLDIL